jgi:ABC-type Fe3+/spermidine/putrescine transport system ATPase subunit
MTALRLDGLVKRFDRLAAIDFGFDGALEVAPRELLVVVGRAGAGKTTLARLIAGLDAPDEGAVRLGERSLNGEPPEKRGVGLVFADAPLWPRWNVAENIGFGLRCRGLGRKARRLRINEVMALVGLEGLGTRRPAELSPLQRRRVAIARTLVLDPDVLLIDEPLDPLDEGDRTALVADLRRVHSEARLTMLVLTRCETEALSLGDRVAVLTLGRIAQVGPPAEIYQQPASREVAEAFGPVNAVRGQVDGFDSRGDVVVRTPLGRLVGRARAESVAPGRAVLALFRPEALAVGTTGFGGNRFPVTLARRDVLGPLCRLHLSGPGGWAGLSYVLAPAALSLRDGQAMTATVAPEAVAVVLGEGGG